MKQERLLELAGILEEQTAPSDAWKKFNKAASELDRVLSKASVEDGGTKDRSKNAFNFEMINDLQFTLEKTQKQLDRLDRRYSWRDFMKKKKERVFGKKS